MIEPHFADDLVTLYHGDCIEVMRELPDASVDAVVTDPPYGLEFMGREWDGANGFRRSLNAADVGRDSVFGRTWRTSPEYSVTSSAKAGMKGLFGAEGSPMPSHLGGLNPKCRVCGKWQRGANPCSCANPAFPNERLPRLHTFQAWCEAWAAECLRVLKPGGHLLAFGGTRTWHRLACAIEDAGFEVRDSIAWLYGSGFPKSRNLDGDWKGWGTALKPAHEPIVFARKPLRGTVETNVTKYSTGALNIEGCRVEGGFESGWSKSGSKAGPNTSMSGPNYEREPRPDCERGRWPANVVLDESQAVELDKQTGVLSSGANPTRRGADGDRTAFGDFTGQEACDPARGADSGGGSRFFYVAKAGQDQRPREGDVAHPTVKPVDLMRWLVRLVTPPGGLVLEPFAGSGTTAEACVIEGFRCLAVEREAAYLPLITQRLTKPIQPDLFGGAA